MCCRMVVTGIIVVVSGVTANAYGPLGHKTIGGIADKLLDGKPVASKVSTLLDGMSLADAALLPDKIKDWDKTPPDEEGAFHIEGYPQIEAQLRAYWEANSDVGASGERIHRESHFVDIPVKDVERYRDGETGRSSVDLVQTMNLCVKVLEGKENEHNPRMITKPVAIVLLSHFVGDIHQPLHVGAEYFNGMGNFIDPDKGQQGYPDRGGNSLDIDLKGVDSGEGRYKKNLHGFWDSDAVTEALKLVKQEVNPGGGRTKQDAVIQYFVDHEPVWKLDPSISVESWAEAWADEIQPTAKEAYERLAYIDMHPSTVEGKTYEKGIAKEKDESDQDTYLVWAGKTVKTEIDKAGWRLAAMIEASLQ